MTASAASTQTALLASHETPLGKDQEYIVRCLVANFSPSQIAHAMQVSESDISQQVKDYGLRERANILLLRRQQGHAEMDDDMDRIESKALRALDKQVSFIVDPMKLLKIATAVNAMKRRSQLESSNGNAETSRVVNIIMPAATAAQFRFNEKNEAIQIGDRTLVSMPGQVLVDAMRKKAEPEKSANILEGDYHEHVQETSKGNSAGNSGATEFGKDEIGALL